MKELSFEDSDIIPFELVGFFNELSHSTILSITDARGVILAVNKNFCSVSGYSESELIGGQHSIVNSGYHSTDYWRSMWRTIASGNFWRGEIRNRQKNGKFYWVDSYIYPIKDQSGSIVKYLSVRHDITEKKEEQLNVLGLKHTLEAIYNSTHSANILVDQTGKILSLNSQACKPPFLLQPDAMVSDCLPTTFYHDFNRIILHTISVAHTIDFERDFIFEDQELHFHVTFTLAIDQRGDVLGVSIDLDDITIQTKVQKQLIDRNKRLEEIAWQQSHVVRSPVATLLGLVNVLEMDWSIENIKQIIPMIKQVTENLDNVIKDIVKETY